MGDDEWSITRHVSWMWSVKVNHGNDRLLFFFYVIYFSHGREDDPAWKRIDRRVHCGPFCCWDISFSNVLLRLHWIMDDSSFIFVLCIGSFHFFCACQSRPNSSLSFSDGRLLGKCLDSSTFHEIRLGLLSFFCIFYFFLSELWNSGSH